MYLPEWEYCDYCILMGEQGEECRKTNTGYVYGCKFDGNSFSHVLSLFFFFSDIWYLLNIIQALTTLEKKKVELLSVNKSFLIVSESIYFPNQRWLVNTNVDFFKKKRGGGIKNLIFSLTLCTMNNSAYLQEL